ncbi:hypothetical protein ACIQPP_05510 [Streptomyces violaceusniger]|uniref:hypothetical protein n=1 Tax=Streptomyces violaceusniger TaxID=68280 RepID=UPI0009960D66|nr:hypothetical protein [Streptomyces hygroscopicus]AQW55278.1 hypothetical protein SHXM_08741 [Streptomyces hygroscopicus]
MDERDEWRLRTDHKTDGLVKFLEARLGEAFHAAEQDSPQWRDVVGKRMIVERCRSVIARPYRGDEDLLRHVAYETLQDLARPWAGARDGTGRHPDYLDQWRP